MLITARRAIVSGAVADKPSRLVSDAEPVAVSGPAPPFVSRGGEKLEAALETFGVRVTGRAVLDVGASTGGFTDCLLQRGATSVVAVDVGRGQLHHRLRAEGRVTVREGVNARFLSADDVGGRAFDVVVADVSFISLKTVLAALLALVAPDGDAVLLVKPQFEAGRKVVSKGKGVVRDPAVWGEVLDGVGAAIERNGAVIMGFMASPLRGAEGNVEFFVHVRLRSSPGS